MQKRAAIVIKSPIEYY